MNGRLIKRLDGHHGHASVGFYNHQSGNLFYKLDFILLFAQVIDKGECIGSALLHRGHSHTGDKFIGIFSQNRPEVKLTSSSHVILWCFCYH